MFKDRALQCLTSIGNVVSQLILAPHFNGFYFDNKCLNH